MTRAIFKHKITLAMKDYTEARLDNIYDMAYNQSKKLTYPAYDPAIKAELFILSCGYENHSYIKAANMMYGAYDCDITEEELINAVKKRLQQRKIIIS